MLAQSIANAQSDRENPSGIEPASSQAAVAAELANPLAPVTTFVAQFRTEFGNGPGDDTSYQLRLQPSLFKPFSDGSALLLRTILELGRGMLPKPSISALGRKFEFLGQESGH
jgi:hypothetical protein